MKKLHKHLFRIYRNTSILLASSIIVFQFLNSSLIVNASTTINEYPITSGLSGPLFTTTGSDGYTWYSEGGSSQVAKMSTSGAITDYSVAPSGTLETDIQGMTEGSDGNVWFTACVETSNHSEQNYVGKITTSGTSTLFAVSGGGCTVGPISSGPDGNVWFIQDYGTAVDIVYKVTPSGTLTPYTQHLTNNLNSITSGPDGNLWFTDSSTNSIAKLSTSGGFVTEYSIPTPYSYPNSITSGPDGNLWFTEGSGYNIGKITTAGAITEYSLPTYSDPSSIIAGTDGNLWFTESGVLSNIASITTSGSINQYPVSGTNAYPYAITQGSDGNLWFTQPEVNKIGQLIPESASQPVVAISAGGSGSGIYGADQDYSGGTSYTTGSSVDTSGVTNPAPESVYQSSRYGTNFSYTIPNLVPNTAYALKLDFNELYWGTSAAGSSGNNGGIGSRVFDVAANGQSVLSNFDIYAVAGGANKAVSELVPVTSDSYGDVTVNFTGVVDNAMVSGLAIYNGTTPVVTPPAPLTSENISAGGSGSGSFVADQNYVNGSSYSSSASVDTSGVTNPAPESVYQSARYGNNFTYNLSNLTPNTSYNVRLDFNEMYWGTLASSYSGGSGSRVFDVAINGDQVLNNFDIYATAGGANKAVSENFTATANANGVISINFTGVTDTAMVSGIEVSQ